eukprot:CAMPEP_0202032978 /NCGR_PEP_ID=MMETSP0905-20130828/65809_1 /ASSEMBLY_ACC=CAM_ASM_000554 /TAXON_ID=420261 /ORGANISM="Thalassiosira antarctica, Strain CCMP982" /LENGTH=388 /DNA_ID=CAMNT_0048596861 /DNA_START=68 /DNA_END=1234 /DNA_ORIENTATION=-
MSKGMPPSSVICFSLLDDLNREDDARSELTVPSYGDDLSQEDDFGIKLAADPYYYNALDLSHHSRAENQEQLDLKLQIVRQQEKLDKLSSNLSQCEVENEALKAENAVRQQEKLDKLSSNLSQCEVENEALKAENAILVDELALTTQEQSTTRRGWFSKGANGNGGSMQLLVDTNAKLMMDNARLQFVIDATRKSFQSYIKDSGIRRDKGKQTIGTLQQEDKLQQWLSVSKNFTLSSSEHTAKTSLESSFTEIKPEDLPIDSSHHSSQDSMIRNSLHSIPEQEFKFETSDDDCIIELEEIEATANGLISERAARRNSMPIMSKETKRTFSNGAARSKSLSLLVEFGEIRKPRRTDRRHSLTVGIACRKSDNLLVNFDESRRARGMDRR